jgi:hypothetical protein
MVNCCVAITNAVKSIFAEEILFKIWSGKSAKITLPQFSMSCGLLIRRSCVAVTVLLVIVTHKIK